MKIKKITFQGWKNCIELNHGDFRIVVTTEIGPRIVGAFLGKGENLLYLEAIRHMDAAGRARLDSYLRLPRYTDADVAAIRAILTESGSAETVRNSIAALSACASAALRQLPDNQWRAMLDTLVEQMLVRSV